MYGLHSLFEAFQYQGFVDFGYLMLLIYFLAMSGVTVYALLQFHLLYLYKKYHKENPEIRYKQFGATDQNAPMVTVQRSSAIRRAALTGSHTSCITQVVP